MRRLIVIGLDGATYDVLNPMLEEGALPYLATIAKAGVRGVLESVFPPVTGPAWTSFATGKNPGRTGVFGFMSRKDKGLETRPIFSLDIKKANPFWDYLSNAGMKVGIYNYPCLYPPYQVNGFMVSGVGTSLGSRFTYPESLKQMLIEECGGYKIAVPLANSRYDNPSLLVEDLLGLLKINEKAIKLLLQKYEPDISVSVISATDFAMHCMWKYIDENHPFYRAQESEKYRPQFIRVWQKVDQVLGSIIEATSEQANLLVVSDHGFGPYGHQFFINSWLEKTGYLYRKEKISPVFFLQDVVTNIINLLERISLKLGSQLKRFGVRYSKPFIYSVDLRKSLAFANVHDYVSGEIYINRFNSRVIRNEEEYKACRKKIIEDLKTFCNSSNIKINIYLPSDIYSGQFLDLAPDILFEINDFECGIHYKFDREIYKEVPPNKNLSGTHRKNGIFFAYGPDIKEGLQMEGAKIYDIAPTILHMFDLPVPYDMDGRVLVEIFREGSELEQREVRYQEIDIEKERIRDKVKRLKQSTRIQ